MASTGKFGKFGKFVTQNGVTLYDEEMSPCARRVRIVLIEKGIPFRKVPIDLNSNENKEPAYLKINPNGKVPALSIQNVEGVPDCVLFESNVITEFLDSVFPGPKLYPGDKWLRAQARMWQDWELSLVDDFVPFVYQNVVPFINRIKYKTREEYRASINPNTPEPRVHMLMKGYDGTYKSKEELENHGIACYKYLQVLEESLNGKTFLVCDSLSIADISVFPRVEMFTLVGLPIPSNRFPNVYRYLQNLKSRKCFLESVNQGIGSKIASGIMGYFPSLIAKVGNFRCGSNFERVDGSNFVDRALKQYKEENEKFSDRTKPEPGTRLVYYPQSSECWQMKLLLEEKGCTFDISSGDLLDIIGRPFGSKGTYRLYHDNRSITGVRTILEYVDGLNDKHNFLSSDPVLRAKVECWQAWEQTMYWIDMLELVETRVFSKLIYKRFKDNLDGLHALESNPDYREKISNICKCFMRGLQESGDILNDEILEKYKNYQITEEEKQKTFNNFRDVLNERLVYMENSLKDNKFLVGKELTLADICVYCRLIYFDVLKIEISESEFPNILRWRNELKTKPNFQKLYDEVIKETDGTS